MKFQRHVLANGLEIIGEIEPNALSAAVGFFVQAGSRDESAELAGVSHFLEHMAFKGSEGRTADDVNRGFDNVGAHHNAYTSEENTVYYAAFLPEYLETVVDLLADLLRPALRATDFDMEKNVILEEIEMYADSPQSVAYEKVMRQFFADHPLGNAVLGTKESVSALTRDAMSAYHASRYAPGNIFVTAAGNINWNELIAIVEKHCGKWTGKADPRSFRHSHAKQAGEVVPRSDFVRETVLMTMDAPPANDDRWADADILTDIIGDETGSRFFWELVEPGKVDGVGISYHDFKDAGVYMSSLSCDPDLAKENLDVMRKIYADVMKSGVSTAEVEQARSKLVSRLVLASERPQSRLFSVGTAWANEGKYRSLDDDLADLAKVTPESIKKLLEEFPLAAPTTVCLGPLEKIE